MTEGDVKKKSGKHYILSQYHGDYYENYGFIQWLGSLYRFLLVSLCFLLCIFCRFVSQLYKNLNGKFVDMIIWIRNDTTGK